MVIQVSIFSVRRRASQELRDGKVETWIQTHRLEADEDKYACGVSIEGEGGREGDEGVM